MDTILASESLLARLFDSTGTFRLGVVCKMAHRPMLRHAFRILQQQPRQRLDLDQEVYRRKKRMEKLIVCTALHGHWDECLLALVNFVRTNGISRKLFPAFARLSNAPTGASQQRLYTEVVGVLHRCFERVRQGLAEDLSLDAEVKGKGKNKGKGKGAGLDDGVALRDLAAVVVAGCLIDVKDPLLGSARDLVRSHWSDGDYDDYDDYGDYGDYCDYDDCGYGDYGDYQHRHTYQRQHRHTSQRCHAADHLCCDAKTRVVPRDAYDTEGRDTFAFVDKSCWAGRVLDKPSGYRCYTDPVDEELFVHIGAAFDTSETEMLDLVMVTALMPAISAISKMNMLCTNNAKNNIMDALAARATNGMTNGMTKGFGKGSTLLVWQQIAEVRSLVKVLSQNGAVFGPDVILRMRHLSVSDESHTYDANFWRPLAEMQLSTMKHHVDACTNNQLSGTEISGATNSIAVAVAVGVGCGLVGDAAAYLTSKLTDAPATSGMTNGFGKGLSTTFPSLLESCLERSIINECQEVDLNNDAILRLVEAKARLAASQRKPTSGSAWQTSDALQALTHHKPEDVRRTQLAATVLMQHGAPFDFVTFAKLLSEEQRTQKELIPETWRECAVQQLRLVLDSSPRDITSQDKKGKSKGRSLAQCEWEPSILTNALLSVAAVDVGGPEFLSAQQALTPSDIKGLSEKLYQEYWQASENPKRALNVFYVKTLVASRADPGMFFKAGRTNDSAFTCLSRMEACRLGVHETALLFLKRDVHLQAKTIISMLHKVPSLSDDAVQWETAWRDTAVSHLQAKLQTGTDSEKLTLPDHICAAVAAGVADVEMARASVPEERLHGILYYFLSLGCRDWMLEPREVETIESWLKFGAITDVADHCYTPLELVALKFNSKNRVGACRVATALASAGAQCTARAMSALLNAAPPPENISALTAQCDAEQWQDFALAQLRRCKTNCAKALLAAVAAGCTGQEIETAKDGFSMIQWTQLEEAFVDLFFHEQINRDGVTTRWVPRKSINLVSLEVLLKVGVHPDTSICWDFGDTDFGDYDWKEWITPLECLARACTSGGKGQVDQPQHQFRSTGKGYPTKPQPHSHAIPPSQGNTEEAAKLLLAYGATPDPQVLSNLGIHKENYGDYGGYVVLKLHEKIDPRTRDPLAFKWVEDCLVALDDDSAGGSDCGPNDW